jgi:hypothetical protein
MVSIPKPISIYELMKQNLGLKRPTTSLASYLCIINPITFPSSLRPTFVWLLKDTKKPHAQKHKHPLRTKSKISNLTCSVVNPKPSSTSWCIILNPKTFPIIFETSKQFEFLKDTNVPMLRNTNIPCEQKFKISNLTCSPVNPLQLAAVSSSIP